MLSKPVSRQFPRRSLHFPSLTFGSLFMVGTLNVAIDVLAILPGYIAAGALFALARTAVAPTLLAE